MNNLMSVSSNHTNMDPTIAFGNVTYPMANLQDRLDALILVLKTCKGKICSDPWAELLPESGVSTLSQAMVEAFDGYFAQLPKVEYASCEDGYILESGGPMWPVDLRGNGSTYVDVHGLARRHGIAGSRP